MLHIFFALWPTHQGYQIGILWDPEIPHPITLSSCNWWDDDGDTAQVIVDNGPAATITREKQIKGYFRLQFFRHTCYHRKVDFERSKKWKHSNEYVSKTRREKSEFNHNISLAFCDEITLARARTKRRMRQEKVDISCRNISNLGLSPVMTIWSTITITIKKNKKKDGARNSWDFLP